MSWFMNMDHTLFEAFNKSVTSGFFDMLMPLLSDLKLWLIPMGIAWVIFFFRGGRRGRLIALCCFLVVAATDQLASSVVKPMVERNRPCNVVPQTHFYHDGQWIYTDKFGLTIYKESFSFPSSHAANIAGQAVYWSYFFPQITPVMMVAAVAVGFSRVYLGHHWPSDILGGYLLGLIVALFIASPLRVWVLPDE